MAGPARCVRSTPSAQSGATGVGLVRSAGTFGRREVVKVAREDVLGHGNLLMNPRLLEVIGHETLQRGMAVSLEFPFDQVGASGPAAGQVDKPHIFCRA